jgi:hypothetical protein
MEKTPTSTFDVGSQHSAAPHGPAGNTLPADDSGNVDDPPPIPSAGSSSRESVLLNDELDGARDTKATNSITTTDSDHHESIAALAHTLTSQSVASLLRTDVE